ncbi:MAG: hypothetical protein V3G42_12380 [Oscillospiraceae bacterium]
MDWKAEFVPENSRTKSLKDFETAETIRSRAEAQAVKKVRESLQRVLQRPVDSRKLHEMFFAFGLREYCVYLSKIPELKQYDYITAYSRLMEYSRIETKKRDNNGIGQKELTVGLMLQKANDLFAYSEDYTWILDNHTLKRYPPDMIACYIVDMLVIKPFSVLKKGENENGNDSECD